METFDRLDARLVRCLSERGIHSPTEAQAKAIPAIGSGLHVLLVAPTGIGKTEAAMLPILDSLAKGGRVGFRCVYVTPLRALNRDLLHRLREFGEALGLKVAVRHGDTKQSERTAQSRDPPDILITTPETLQIMFTGKILRKHLSHVKFVVIDEIHELAEDERGAQLSVALERLVDIAGEFVARLAPSAHAAVGGGLPVPGIVRDTLARLPEMPRWRAYVERAAFRSDPLAETFRAPAIIVASDMMVHATSPAGDVAPELLESFERAAARLYAAYGDGSLSVPHLVQGLLAGSVK